MTRVLMLNCEFPPLGGGAGNATYHLLREFSTRDDLEIDLVTSSARDGDEVSLFSPRIAIYTLDVRKGSPHYWTLPELTRWMWRAYWFARRLVREKRYDLSHCWFGWPSGIIGYLLRKHMPSLVALRGSDVPGYNARFRILDRLVLKHVSKVVWRSARILTANSCNLRELALRTYDRKPIHVIYNGVDTNGAPAPRRRAPWSLLFVGRLIKRKGVECLIEAFRRVCAASPAFRLLIVGEGPERERLEQLCAERRVADRVTFTGSVERTELDALYRTAHVLVVPSVEESLANVVLEGMACGLPVVTTATGAAEVVDGNGFVVERDDPERLSDAILSYARDPALQRLHGERSYEIAQGMGWHTAAEEYRRLYDVVCGRLPASVIVA